MARRPQAERAPPSHSPLVPAQSTNSTTSHARRSFSWWNGRRISRPSPISPWTTRSFFCASLPHRARLCRKNYAPQHLILMPAFRSPDTTRVCLFNNTYLTREEGAELNSFAAFKTSNITPRVLDEIVWPMRQLQMREQEFVCLKVPLPLSSSSCRPSPSSIPRLKASPHRRRPSSVRRGIVSSRCASRE